MKITKLNWDEAKPLINQANTGLCAAVDQIKFTKKYPLYLLEYDYGEMIDTTIGGFQYPKETYGKLFKLIPFSVVTDKTFEMFIEMSGKSFSYRLYKKGNIFHTVQFLENNIRYEPRDVLQISSGSRNSFLLPKISDAGPHKEMCAHFNTQFRKPQTLDDHYYVFRDLCKYGKCNWTAKLIAFSDEWVEDIKKYRPTTFYEYINEYNNRFDAYFRCTQLYNFILSYIRSECPEIPSNTFLYDVVRQFYTIGCGQTPTYVPAIDDESIPFSFIANVYKEIYKIKTIPFAMVPSYLDSNSKLPSYYSIAKEGLIFKPKKLTNILRTSVDIKDAFNLFSKEMTDRNLYDGTQFQKCAKKLKVSVFHDRRGSYSDVLNTTNELFRYDHRFKQIADMLSMNIKQYQSTSYFFTGAFGLKF